MVERTFKILNVYGKIFNHFFCFMYEINIFEHKRPYNFEHRRSNNFYRTLKKAVLMKFWLVFRYKK